MDTKVNAPAPAALRLATPAQQQTIPTRARAAAPDRAASPQAAPAVDPSNRPALKQASPSSALTTYKDEDSGRLVVRVFDRESGEVLIEFPPERAFRAVAPAPGKAVLKPGKSFSA